MYRLFYMKFIVGLDKVNKVVWVIHTNMCTYYKFDSNFFCLLRSYS